MQIVYMPEIKDEVIIRLRELGIYPIWIEYDGFHYLAYLEDTGGQIWGSNQPPGERPKFEPPEPDPPAMFTLTVNYSPQKNNDETVQ